MMAEKSNSASPWIPAWIRRSKYIVQPSFSQLLNISWICSVKFGEKALQVLPAGVGHEVPTPAVAQLMGNHIHILPVTTDDSRRCKGVDWILHALGSTVSRNKIEEKGK